MLSRSGATIVLTAVALLGCVSGETTRVREAAPWVDDEPSHRFDHDAEAVPIPVDDAGTEPPEAMEPASGGELPLLEEVAPPPPPPPPDPSLPEGWSPDHCRRGAGSLMWSCDGPIRGAHCVAVNEPNNADGWRDNFVCTATDIGLRWSSAGPYADMRCTAVNEPGDTHGWSDNYLCLPRNSPFSLRWSAAGDAPPGYCVPWIEPDEGAHWRDNHLCLDGGALASSAGETLTTGAGPTPPRLQAVFSRREASNGDSPLMEFVAAALIGRALPRSRVRMSLVTLSVPVVAEALVAAHRRGVDVQVVFDGDAESANGSRVAELRAALGPGRVTVCRAGPRAWIGTNINHHKTWRFSALDDGTRNVVVQTSHNLSVTQRRRHNDALIVRNDRALFMAYERVFGQQQADRVRDGDYFHVRDGAARTRAYFFPQERGDAVVAILNNVDCDGGGRIRVAQAYFLGTRLEVARALVARRQEGCDVRVIVGDETAPIGPRIRETLRAGGVDLSLCAASGDWRLHSRYLLVDARYRGSRRRLVFTGSHNLTGESLRDNDETLLRVEDDTVFNAYLRNWKHIRSFARP